MESEKKWSQLREFAFKCACWLGFLMVPRFIHSQLENYSNRAAEKLLTFLFCQASDCLMSSLKLR